MTTPKLLLPELIVGQSGKELTHNQALAILDQLTQPTVVDKDLAAPPGSPANGSMYIVAAAATGTWSGQSGKLAVWLTTVAAWTFITPANGWSVWVTDEAKRYELLAGVWTIVSTGGGGGGGGGGANSTALDGLTGAANKIPYFTGMAAMALSDYTAAARTFNAASSAAAQAAAIGLGTADAPSFSSLSASVSSATNPRISHINAALSVPSYSSTGFDPSLATGEIGRASGASYGGGGVAYNGFTNNTAGATPVSFLAYHGSTSPTAPALLFYGFKHDGSTNRQALASGEIVAQFNNGTTGRLQCLGDGTWRPVGDNSQPLGGASNRWSVVYAGTGTINTSDAREKTAVRALSAGEIAAAKQLSREIGAYEFLSAIQLKGTAARAHIGMTVQRAIEVMLAHDLEPLEYGFICHDEWEEQPRVLKAKVADEEEDEELAPYRPAGDRYGFRMDELMMFLAAGFEARLSALE